MEKVDEVEMKISEPSQEVADAKREAALGAEGWFDEAEKIVEAWKKSDEQLDHGELVAKVFANVQKAKAGVEKYKAAVQSAVEVQD